MPIHGWDAFTDPGVLVGALVGVVSCVAEVGTVEVAFGMLVGLEVGKVVAGGDEVTVGVVDPHATRIKTATVAICIDQIFFI